MQQRYKVVASCCPQQRTKEPFFQLVDLVALNTLFCCCIVLHCVALSRVPVRVTVNRKLFLIILGHFVNVIKYCHRHYSQKKFKIF